jgi:hypothetical protein
MASPQRQSRLYAIKEHALAEIRLLKEEINIFLDNPVGVAGHTSPLSDVTDMIDKIAIQRGVIETIEKEFKDAN